MPVVPLTDHPDSFYALLGHRPTIQKAWQDLDAAMMAADSTLPVKLKENVRRALASGHGCVYCASFGEPTDEPRDAKESLALAFVEQVTSDHKSIDPSTFDVLREEFTDEQIVELCAWICFKLGANTLGAIAKLEPTNEDQRATYEQWLEAREAAKV